MVTDYCRVRLGGLRRGVFAGLAAGVVGTLLMASSAVAQTPTMLVLRAAPGKSADAAAPVPPLKKEDIAEIKIGGKPAEITGFDPLLKGPHTLQLMIVMDSMQMLGSTDKFADLKRFVDEMPSNVEIGVGWLLQSHVKVTQPPTTDRALVDKVLIPQTREEAGNPKNDNGNPFSCLRDLAAHWPNADATKLRAVLVFTDGIIRSNAQSQAGDQESPDVDGASQSLERAGIIPYPFYWMDPPPPVDPNRSEGGPLEGQQNFSQLVKYSGGYPLFEGMFSPGSIGPLLDRLYTVLQSEAVVTVTAKGSPGKFTRLDVKATSDDMKIVGPDSVMIGNVWKK